MFVTVLDMFRSAILLHITYFRPTLPVIGRSVLDKMWSYLEVYYGYVSSEAFDTFLRYIFTLQT
jgi:hypothetical protein